MKTYSCIAILVYLTFTAFGNEIVLGKVLSEDFPHAKGKINYEDVRKGKHLSIPEVVKFGDEFLTKTFGPNFRPKVFRVSYGTVRVTGGEIWCWVIGYHHPEGGEFNGGRIFRVYLSEQGHSLMKVTDKQ